VEVQLLELSTTWKWVVSFVPRPLHPRGKSSRYPMGRWREISWPCWESSPGRPARSPSRCWLCYPGFVCIKQIRIIFTATFFPFVSETKIGIRCFTNVKWKLIGTFHQYTILTEICIVSPTWAEDEVSSLPFVHSASPWNGITIFKRTNAFGDNRLSYITCQ
jgi:hypothetical protein